MTKAEKDLGKAIAREHYVELTTEAKHAAAKKLALAGLVRIYRHDEKLWAKALTRVAYDEMTTW